MDSLLTETANLAMMASSSSHSSRSDFSSDCSTIGSGTGMGTGPGMGSDAMKEITVGILGSGQMFGELSILDPAQPAPSSAFAYTNVDIYVFQAEFILSLGARFNTVSVKALTDSLSLYNPPGDKLIYYSNARFMWEKKKKKTLLAMFNQYPNIANKTSLSPAMPHKQKDFRT